MSTQKNEHNPDNLTPEQVGKGFRLLQYGEVIDPMDEMYITRFGNSRWEPTGPNAPGHIIEKAHYAHRRRVTPPSDTTGSGREGAIRALLLATKVDDHEVYGESVRAVVQAHNANVDSCLVDLSELIRQRDAALAQLEALRRDGESAERRAAIWMSLVHGLPTEINARFHEAAKQFDDRAAIDSAQRQEGSKAD